MRTRAIASSLLTILSLALAQSAYSDFTVGTIDVDFNGSVSPSASALDAGVIGSTGDAWNIVAGTQSLNFTTGWASGVTLQLTGSFATGTNGGANGPNAGLTQDFLAVTGVTPNTGTVTLAGLTSGQQYALYLYNGSTSIGRITDFSVAGTSTVTGSINNVNVPLVGTATWTPATAIIPGNYLQLNATANASGQLVIEFMNKAASEGDFAGFQIRAIPEPSTYALLLAGTATLLIVAYRTRRRASAK